MERTSITDALDFFKNCSVDIQEGLILTMAKNPSGYSYWSYDVATRTIFVDNLMELRQACDYVEQHRSIWLAVLTGLPKKLVVETCYSSTIKDYGTRISVDLEQDDPAIKAWMLQVIPDHEKFKGFPVEFVFNPPVYSHLQE